MVGLPAPDPPPRTLRAGAEREILRSQLEDKQTILLRKIAGLSEGELRRAPTASSLSLLGLVKHSAYVHQWWFRRIFAGENISFAWADADPEFDFRPEANETAEDIAEFFRDEVRRASAIVDAADLDDVALAPLSEREDTLRGIMIHVIQEMARHLGHADIIREAIDGSTGD